MDNGLIPRRYAKALYKFATSHGKGLEVYNEMKTVENAFSANPELQKTLANPFVSKGDKSALLKAAAGDKVENDYLGFIDLLLEMKREEFARLISLAYIDLYRRENKISQVKVTTAHDLPAEEMERLLRMVSQAFEGRTLEISTAVDADLIGGFVVDVDDVRMDASLSNEIEQLRLNLITK
ncbi:MAG: F0F1 ATP synthase subunit delta [Muribaculaceae bacterium]|nr:F0F1 ATP synthase subunit delta [Muribaculaceae bacterium]